MSVPPAEDSFASRSLLPPLTAFGFAIALVAILAMAAASVRAVHNLDQTATSLTDAMEELNQIQQVLSTLKDAETGQRGYLLSDRESYLQPYNDAQALLKGELSDLRRLTANDPADRSDEATIEILAAQKMAELQETIDLKRAGDSKGALGIVLTDRGRLTMTRLRQVADTLTAHVTTVVNSATRTAQYAAAISLWLILGGAALLVILVVAAAVAASRDFRALHLEGWLQSAAARLPRVIEGNQSLETLGDRALAFLCGALGARIGALFVTEADGSLRRIAGYALPAGEPAVDAIGPGQGLLGQAVRDRQILATAEIPADYYPIRSALGATRAQSIIVAPLHDGERVHAVVELGFLRPLQQRDTALLGRVSEAIAVGLRSATDRERLARLLEETQRQAEELQTQQEELRVSNEELEEYGRVLRDSQVRLESQHAELEQTNVQLEEQAHTLELQKSDLSEAQQALSARAQELARLNTYKSEFLANMSHELRTPLNSALILARLLAENKAGNLTDEQMKFASTIESAGKDLLDLINDVLDLSKIDAGHADIRPEACNVRAAVEAVRRTFEPIAAQKNLRLRCVVDGAVPQQITTDPRRLAQILRNLVSNACKFADAGEITVTVTSAASEDISFAVQDTGIGIAASQQAIIFEAFRQADGTIHRRFGGSGLGLSISRDLARLLGGDITLASAPGKGSTFTLTLPVVYSGIGAAPPLRLTASAETPAARRAAAPSAELVRATVADDRERLGPNSRTLLVVEDDVRFAEILRDLARDMGFACVLVDSAEQALLAVKVFPVRAIVLDMHLPDSSGLVVLERLKSQPETRHIPVHVVSVADYRHQALGMGAVSYAMKPVARAELADGLARLAKKLAPGERRILLVEDDARQRESMRALLAAEGVEIKGVGTAAEALAALANENFDCLILDLTLPDITGYQLLESLSRGNHGPLPPVIVYTGRHLSQDEEQALRRFSESIIVKDARSPERLLDEVTLFLHQVEEKLPAERQRMLREARNRDHAFEGRTILVVEDDARNIFALSKILEPKGASVAIARNGHEALAALARSSSAGRNPDLVLMDIMMPEMDGLTAIREIRKRPDWARLPIIALTAKAMKDDQEACLAAGANDYIAKPLDVDKLLSLARVWMVS
jgi:CheY-like chemotaxis protein/signal transduction histidine kinase/CHASE3 domain sensor protein